MKMSKPKPYSIPSLFLVANSISWFSLTINIILQQFTTATSFDKVLIISGSYFGSLIFSAIIGATLLVERLKGKTFIIVWVLIGALSSLLFSLLISGANLLTMILLSLFLGFSAGLGIPNCLSLFANQAKIEKRGRLGALMFFAIQIFTALIILPLNGAGTDYQFLILSGWRLVGIVSIFFYKTSEVVEKRKTSLTSIIRERTFILYFLPWFLFTLVNFIEAPIFEAYVGPQVFSDYTLATFVISSLSAFVGGFLCDFKGRKVTAIVGFVFLGLGYAFLSFLSEGLGRQVAQLLFVSCDGIAWGMLYVTFIFVVWGDLSEGNNREKYYLLGGIPFLFSGIIQALVQPFAKFIPINASFSLASFFLFVAILPLLYATESLPEKVLKNRDIGSYAEKALKQAQKDLGKNQRKDQGKAEEENEKATEEPPGSPDDEEARKLAEKYY
jgi:MFS family permease